MTPTPFCCDINSGSVEERNEFKRMLEKASSSKYGFISAYYGYNKYGEWDMTNSYKIAEVNFNGNILPLSEGITILKEMVGEGPKTKVNEHSLLPCPFCGGDCEVGMNGRSQYVVKCYPCSVSMSDDRKDKVVTNWNNRQPKP